MNVIKIENLILLFELEDETLTITGNDVLTLKFQNAFIASVLFQMLLDLINKITLPKQSEMLLNYVSQYKKASNHL